MSKRSVSHGGTGNGVSGDNLTTFVDALADYARLMNRIVAYYKNNPQSSFSGEYHLLNNWHNTYKIGIRQEDFPYEMCNGVYVRQGGWNDLQLSVTVPLRFNAPTFNGPDTDRMQFALVTEINMGDDNMKSLMENKRMPKVLKMEILSQFKTFLEKKTIDEYTKKAAYLTKEVERYKEEIIQHEKDIAWLNSEIPEMEERIKIINSILKEKA